MSRVNDPADNPAFTARPEAASGAADQAAPTTLSTVQDVPVERSLRVDTSVFDEQTWQRAREIIARYPQSRSALLPMLHLVQSVQGHVSQAGIAFCAQLLGITTAEVSAVVTFYTMYKRTPGGEHLVSVCTNTLCAALGGDEIYARLCKRLGIGHEETVGRPGSKGSITLEHAECLAACDLAPVLQVNYEFYDNQTPESAVELVGALRRGDRPAPTRGAPLTDWRSAELQLAGFFGEPQQLRDAVDAPSAAPETLAGNRLAEENGWQAPTMPDKPPPLPTVPDKK
ncbi:MAG TPA: NADH-quinone oxidoreductase subunit NuoE [Pseudonocardiaceae bacterium]|jgi:NADH-quinone oxidoreductase subunit E|nr:NADH-quinone oxidoreductase subunit NuoE [Pseudonocardiaceae bacterium]